MCWEEADLVSKVLTVLHHHSLCGGLIWHAESPLASLLSQIPCDMFWFSPALCGLRSSQMHTQCANLKQQDPTSTVLLALIGHWAHAGCLRPVGCRDAQLWPWARPTDSCVMHRAVPGKPPALLSGCEGIWLCLPCAATMQMRRVRKVEL